MKRFPRTRRPAFLAELFTELAPQIGARVLLEPEWGIAGQIIFKSGRKRYFRYTSIDLNTLGSSEIAKDKDYASFFLKKNGYPVIEGRAFFSPAWSAAIGSDQSTDAAVEYALSFDFPLVIKPNSQSQGRGVQVVRSKRELLPALRRVFKLDRVALLQKYVTGRDYRIVVLDGVVISAYERIPLSVIGDGHSTIAALLTEKQKGFVQSGRDTVILSDDPRIALKLSSQKMTIDSVPEKAFEVFLLDNANLSSGGDARDVTEAIHPEWARICADITHSMGLRLSGVDILTQTPLTMPPQTYVVIEINAAPGLDHYASGGVAQKKIVKDLYLKVLTAMESA